LHVDSRSSIYRSVFVFRKERKKDFHCHVDGSDSEEEYYDENDHDDLDHDEESDEDTSYDTTRRPRESCRILICHLGDACTLCKVYAIAIAIPISSATAKRSFSALKRVKTRNRSTLLQGRLKALFLVAVERGILQSLLSGQKAHY
jgi:hypothetical protein